MRSILIINVVMVVVILIAIVVATIEIPMKSPGAHGPIAHRGIWGPIFLLQGAGVAALLSDALPVEAMRAVFPYWFGTWIWQN